MICETTYKDLPVLRRTWLIRYLEGVKGRGKVEII